jgi:ferritin
MRLNGHSDEIVSDFNMVANQFEATELLYIILNNYCDDGDIQGITEYLEDRIRENQTAIDGK